MLRWFPAFAGRLNHPRATRLGIATLVAIALVVGLTHVSSSAQEVPEVTTTTTTEATTSTTEATTTTSPPDAAAPSTAPLPAPTIESDKADYPPGGTVVLTGTNWLPDDTVTINVNDDTGTAWEKDVTVHANANGEITYTFVLPNQFIANYAVTAVGSDGRTATTTFTDAPSGRLDQCANGPQTPNTSGCNVLAASWVNGNLNQNNSLYLEGDSVPYRVVGSEIPTGPTPNTVVIEWDTMQQNKHAIDFITTFNRTVIDANPCLGVTGCDTANPTTFPIPPDSEAGGFQIPGVLTMYGGTISNAVYSSPGGNDAPRRLTITFTATQANPVLAWAGHIATRVDWGFGNSAASISGSPFHTRLIELNGSGGNQDRSLSAAAVIFPATITILKDAVPNTETAFPFSATGPEMPTTPFNLVDNGVDADRTITFSNLITFGTARTVTEGPVPSGWTLSNLDCVIAAPAGVTVGTVQPDGPGSGPTATFNLLEANSAICTFTNVQQGSVVIIKDTVPNGPTDFSFTATNSTTPASPPTPTNFALDDDLEDQALSNSQTLSGLEPGQTYLVTETTANDPPYTLTNLECDGGGANTTVNIPAGVATIVFDEGETIVCTFTNAAPPALTLVKQVSNDNGGTAVATDWTLSAAGPTPTSGLGGFPATEVLPGTYDLSETTLAGYTPGSWTCTGTGIQNGAQITLALGEFAICTITNDDQPAALTLRKVVDNGITGATGAPVDWVLSAVPVAIPGQSTVTGSGNPDAGGVNAVPVFAGAYDLEEFGLAGYTPSAWTCTGGTLVGSRLTIANGASADCTITNTALPPTLTLQKTVTNGNGGTALPAAWTLTADGPVDISGAGGVPVTPVQVGTYTLSELGPTGYFATPWICNGIAQPASQITIALNQNVTCSINNDDIAPTLMLLKTVVNGTTGSTTPATAWTLSAAGPTPVLGGTTPVFSTVNAGTYTLSESGPSGYTASDWLCTGGASSTATSITLTPGQNGVCTITNTAIAPTLTVVKTVTNNGGGTAVATDWTLAATGPPVTPPVSGATGSSNVTDRVVPIGTYTLSESGPTGYTPSAWTCTNGVAVTDASITLALGQSTTCTITNTAITPRLTLVKEVVNDDGGTALPTEWTLRATGPTLGVNGATGDAAITDAPVNAGTYLLSEDGPPGYAASVWSCVGATSSDPFNVEVQAGDVATCTITNNDQQAELTLVKTVTNDDGGTATADQWTLSATGPTPITGTTGNDAITDVPVDAGTYTLSEGGPAGYTGTWECLGDGVNQIGTILVLDPGVDATCTIVNDDQPASLTLSKLVDNGATGATHAPAEWTLTATPVAIVDQDPVSGAGGVDAVPVFAGSYDLSEDGPLGYDASDWVCTGATLVGSRLTVANGASADCTITNTAIPPTLTLVKVIDNGDGLGTSVLADWTLSAIGPTTTIAGISGTAAVTNVTLPIGTYDLRESADVGGYTPSVWDCDGILATTNEVLLVLGQDAVCTITNTAQQPTLTLVKQVTNDNGGTALATAWTLAAAGTTPNSTASISGQTGSSAVTAAPVNAGSYTLTEANGPSGYLASSWVCTGATVTTATSVEVQAGDDATCTIANDDVSASLSLDKIVTNNNGGLAVETDWTLTADGPTDLTGAGGVPPSGVLPGVYTLAESTGPAGYAPSAWTCTAGVVTGNTVTLALGETAVCTINNDDVSASLSLDKVVTNNNGGTAVETDWTLSASGPTPLTGAGGVAPTQVLPGVYTLSESTGPAGYAPSAWTCTAGVVTGNTVTLALGETAVCTINNDDVSASLSLDKVVTNNNGGTAVETDWTLSATGPTTPLSGAGGMPPTDVLPGVYTLSESTGPAGYAPSAWTCTAGVVTGNTVTLALGETAVCTINNDDVSASLSLDKVVTNNNGGTAVETDWTLTATGPTTPLSGAGGMPPTDVLPGTYTLSETGTVPGYAASAWTCTGTTAFTDTTVTVALGETAVCTINNDDVPASLTLVKEIVLDDGGTADATDWDLTATGPTMITGAVGDTAVTNAAVSAGSYVLSEDGPAGYTPSDWSCSDGVTVTDAGISLALGQSTTCTITNDDNPATLTLVKTVINDNGGAEVATAWDLTAAGPTTITGAVGDESVTNAAVDAGTYELSEDGPSGYTAGDWNCVGATLNGSTLTIALGDNVTCTITNDDQPAQLTLVKSVTNNNGGTAVETDWALTATGPTTITGATGDALVTEATVDAGAYTLTESGGPSGYTPGAWSCDAGTLTGDSLVLTPGLSATCTIVNDDQLATWTMTKSAVPPTGSIVEPGTTLTYTLAAMKIDGVDATSITITDDLSDVLDNATLVTSSLAWSTGTLTITGTTLTWTIPMLSQRETASYQVVVNSGATNSSLVNVAGGIGVTPPTNCPMPMPAQVSTAPFALRAPIIANTIRRPFAVSAATLSAGCATTHETRVLSATVTQTPENNDTGSDNGSQPTQILASTGGDSFGLVEWAILMFALGAGFLFWRRRRDLV